MPRKNPMTTESFIEKANKRHNNKYEYSQTEYVHHKTLVQIICPVHGSFLQNPMHHLRGNGCMKCAREQRTLNNTKETEDVVKDFIGVHGDMYDYSKMKYEGTHHKVEIICSKHGSFYQKPNDHLHGTGCPICAIEQTTTSLEDFILSAQKVHGTRYDYSKVDYKNNKEKVEIVCSVHGSFFQLPQNHVLHRCGCSKCSFKEIGDTRRMSQEEFVSRATTTHDGKYNYSKVEYKGNSTKIEIICPEHGSFWQKAANHLHMGQGCPVCNQYVGVYTEHLFKMKPELKDISALVYFVEFSKGSERFQKIGITKRSVTKRFQSKKGYSVTSRYERATTLYEAFKIEQHIKRTWKRYKYVPLELIGGDSECFVLDDDECMNVIRSIQSTQLVPIPFSGSHCK